MLKIDDATILAAGRGDRAAAEAMLAGMSRQIERTAYKLRGIAWRDTLDDCYQVARIGALVAARWYRPGPAAGFVRLARLCAYDEARRTLRGIVRRRGSLDVPTCDLPLHLVAPSDPDRDAARDTIAALAERVPEHADMLMHAYRAVEDEPSRGAWSRTAATMGVSRQAIGLRVRRLRESLADRPAH